MYQILWSELIEPQFSEEDKEFYPEIGIQQVYPVGNEVENRRLFHGLGTKESIDKMLEFTKERGKESKIIRVSDIENILYGYGKFLKEEATEETEAIYEIIRDEELELFPENEDNIEAYFQEIISQDEEENDIPRIPPSNCFYGWRKIN